MTSSAQVQPGPDDPEQLRLLCVHLARVGGQLAAELRAERVEVAATKSSASDVVTVADRAVEALLRQSLQRLRPDDAVLGEEGQDTPGTSGLTWVIDPIDGTVNYLYGLPQYATSVAVVSGDPRRPGDWTSLAGAVFNPALDRCWSAAAGRGAWVQGPREQNELSQLKMGAPAELAGALVGTGFGYLAQQRLQQGKLLATLLPRVRDIRRLGSAALDLCAVAEGTLDAHYEAGLNVWDIAAGVLIVSQAGGTILGPSGGPADRTLLVAARSPLVQQLHELVDPAVDPAVDPGVGAGAGAGAGS